MFYMLLHNKFAFLICTLWKRFYVNMLMADVLVKNEKRMGNKVRDGDDESGKERVYVLLCVRAFMLAHMHVYMSDKKMVFCARLFQFR